MILVHEESVEKEDDMKGHKTATLKSDGCIRQKNGDLFSVRLHIVGGRIEGYQLSKLQEISDKYGRGYIHITTRQGVEIPYVHIEDLDRLEEELREVGLEIGVAGHCVRTIVACQGRVCPHGIIDTQELASRLDKEFYGRGGLPNKLKISIAGCPNSCAKPQENDIGIMGVARKKFTEELCMLCGLCAESCPVNAIEVTDEGLKYDEKKCIGCGRCGSSCPDCAWDNDEKGYKVFMGGKMGRNPRLGVVLFEYVDDINELFRIIDGLIEIYKEEGNEGERFRDTMDRLGVDHIRNRVAHGLERYR